MMNKLGQNWQWKIACLLVAIVLWFIVINEQNPTSEGSYTVPVAVENLDSRYIASNVPTAVYVRLSGPRNTIVNIGANDIKAYVDLTDVEEGEVNVPVHLRLPAGTELKKQSIKTADIMVDLYAVQEFTITPQYTGKLDDKLSVENLRLVPEKVTVSGARRLMKLVDKAVISIPLDGKGKDFAMMAPIQLIQEDGTPIEGLQVTPRQINAKITIAHNAISKKVPVNLITYGAPDSSVKLKRITITPNEVEVRGAADTVDGLNRINLMPISIDGLAKNHEWKVAVPPTEGVFISPDYVKVLVEVE
jgi:YbbR domain-containing protein